MPEPKGAPEGEESQEVATAVHESETSETAEIDHAKDHAEPEKEELKVEAEPSTVEAPPLEEKPFPSVPEEKSAVTEAQPPEEEQKRRASSAKRASFATSPKAISINQETFTPPEALISETRRVSSFQSARRSSIPGQRKSKFGGLNVKARMVLGSIVDIKMNATEMYDRKVAKYQNTYKLDSDNPFNPEKVDKILKEVMQEVMENLHYDPEKCASTAKYASSQIRTKVKQLDFERYKLICVVSIGEKNSQDVYATCRFLWDAEKDRFSFYSLENTHVYAIAYCFGLYFE